MDEQYWPFAVLSPERQSPQHRAEIAFLEAAAEIVLERGASAVTMDGVAARTGVRDREATAVGFDPLTVTTMADDHKAYYPGSHRIAMRYTGDRKTGRLLGAQLYGHRQAEVAKRIDIVAAAIFNEMSVDAMSTKETAAPKGQLFVWLNWS